MSRLDETTQWKEKVKGQATESQRHPTLTEGISHKDTKLSNHDISAEDLVQTHADAMIAASDSVSPMSPA